MTGKDRNSTEPSRQRQFTINILYAFAAILIVMAIQSWWGAQQQTAEIEYSTFQHLAESGQVKTVAVSANYITGELKKPIKPGGPTHFRTTRVDPSFAAELQKYGIEYKGHIDRNILGNILSWLLPIAVLIGFWWFAMRRVAERQGLGGLMQIGKSKAKVYVEQDTGVSFEDVAGVEEAKQELQETVSFLKSPARYHRLGARQPKGILLVGPPGTGKTLLARALAGEAGVPFFSISGPEFVEMFVGVGAARVRDLFKQARDNAPCIIFIDELDALGRARMAGPMPGGHEEKEQTLNQLLDELDGFDPRAEVVILAATNQPQVLDPALLRAGRFDRQVLVDKPDRAGREAILKVHAHKVALAEDVDLGQVADLTTGFSGADLENLVNEAAIVATRREGDAVTLDDFTQGVERLVAGLERKSRVLGKRERRIVAYHEMGHAIVAWVLPGVDPVHKVSIIPRSVGALGYTMQRPSGDRYMVDEEELSNRLAVLHGGRAAEELVFQRATTGAADDIAKATDMARAIVTQYGMDEDVGRVAYEQPRQGYLDTPFGFSRERQYAEATAREIDKAVRGHLDRAHALAKSVLSANRRLLDRAAQELLQHETLEHADLERLLADAHAPERKAA